MISLCLLAIGVLGTLAMTWLFPVLASFSALRSRLRRPATDLPKSKQPLHIAVLIPAHNEERNLERTLTSIRAAMAATAVAIPGSRFTILVGSDGSTDATCAVARRHGAQVFHSERSQGKWTTLKGLLPAAKDADWLVLADAGIQWPEDFVTRLVPHCHDETVMGIAPTYRTTDAGMVESLLWSVERHFKDMESAAGGPVAVHGPTVLYRRADFVAAIDKLGEGRWINDDVVVPLTLRALFPGKSIRHLSNISSFDELRGEAQGNARKPPKERAREFSRRRRMVYGNVQWMSQLLPRMWSQNSTAGLLAMRRVFRMLWAYWGLSLALGAALLVRDRVPAAAPLCLAAGFLAMNVVVFILLRRTAQVGAAEVLVDSAKASLLSPYYFILSANAERISWK